MKAKITDMNPYSFSQLMIAIELPSLYTAFKTDPIIHQIMLIKSMAVIELEMALLLLVKIKYWIFLLSKVYVYMIVLCLALF